jgi:hypothetical protein
MSKKTCPDLARDVANAFGYTDLLSKDANPVPDLITSISHRYRDVYEIINDYIKDVYFINKELKTYKQLVAENNQDLIELEKKINKIRIQKMREKENDIQRGINAAKEERKRIEQGGKGKQKGGMILRDLVPTLDEATKNTLCEQILSIRDIFDKMPQLQESVQRNKELMNTIKNRINVGIRWEHGIKKWIEEKT